MVLNISGVEKNFGKKSVLKNVSISAIGGECVGILGVNGSGKSTFFNVLAGITGCDAGTALLDGHELLKDKNIRKELVGYVTQNPPLLDELTAYDNLLLWYDRKNILSELDNGVLKMLGIGDFLKVRVSKMSGGMKKRLAIGCAVAHNPKMLLLDEPTGALDFVCKEKITEYLESFKAKGGIILLATHDVQDLPLCDKMYIVKNGFSAQYAYDGDVAKLAGALI